MAQKSLKVRLNQRRAKASYWNNHDFQPGAGEIIVYLPDEPQSDISFKIGDGNTLLSELPMFVKASAGPKGEDGVGIADIKIENSDLLLKYTNSSTYINLGRVVGADGTNGPAGENGKDGTTFIPEVSSEGVLSWTNNGGFANPSSVNIKGSQGTPGPAGKDGFTPNNSSLLLTSILYNAQKGAELHGSLDLSGTPEGVNVPFITTLPILPGNNVHIDANSDNTSLIISAEASSGSGGLSSDDRQKLDALTLDGAQWATNLHGFAETTDETDLTKVSRAQYVTSYVEKSLTQQTTQFNEKIDAEIKPLLLPTVSTAENGKILRVIDGAWKTESLSSHASNALTATVTINVEDWVATTNRYQCVKDVSDVKSDSIIICEADNENVSCTAQADGKLTFETAIKPLNAVTTKVVIL